MQPDDLANIPPVTGRRLSIRRAISLMELLLLLIVGSVGLFYVVRMNQLATIKNHALATATAQTAAFATATALAAKIPYPPIKGHWY